ncbi:hypothetical protein M153_13140001450 [Pseudoloma neurophilia]|uniref:Uncharacterized protein n=1 Tax=Pseudoloma neurophilia TaxID=146866 RepID=A0A0R0M0Q6_9MICR|nr:hypothetical protein M153_13140001450 [Pseudoloma neurophilia]
MNPITNKKLFRVTTDNSPSSLYERHLSSLAIKHGHCNLISNTVKDTISITKSESPLKFKFKIEETEQKLK